MSKLTYNRFPIMRRSNRELYYILANVNRVFQRISARYSIKPGVARFLAGLAAVQEKHGPPGFAGFVARDGVLLYSRDYYHKAMHDALEKGYVRKDGNGYALTSAGQIIIREITKEFTIAIDQFHKKPGPKAKK